MQCAFLRVIVCVLISTLSPLLIAGCKKEQKNSASPTAKDNIDVIAVARPLITIGDNEEAVTSAEESKHADGMSHRKQIAQIVVEVSNNGKGFAYIAKVGGKVHVVHNGKPGKFYDNVESNRLTVSSDGQRVAYTAKQNDSWYVIVDGVEKGAFAETGGVEFSPDSRHVVYEAKSGDKWYLYVDDMKNTGADMYYDKPIFVGNSDKLLYIENTNQKGAGIYRLIVSDLKFNNSFVMITNPEYLTVSADRSTAAAVIKEGLKKKVISLRFDQPERVTGGALFTDIICKTVVSKDGRSISYLAKDNGASYLVFNDRTERLPHGEYPLPPVIRPDRAGASVAIFSDERAYIHHGFYVPAIKDKAYDEVGDLTYSADSRLYAYIVRKNGKFIIVINGNEGPPFDRIIAPKFSPDDKKLIYLARKDDKRFVVVADTNGKTIRQFTGYDRVFEPTFTSDGTSVAYGAMQGKKLLWLVEKL